MALLANMCVAVMVSLTPHGTPHKTSALLDMDGLWYVPSWPQLAAEHTVIANRGLRAEKELACFTGELLKRRLILPETYHPNTTCPKNDRKTMNTIMAKDAIVRKCHT